MSDRSTPEMSLVPPLVIALGLVAAFAVGGYWLMKPTVLRNPGVAAYQRPASAKVLDSGSDKLLAAELAANALADKENKKLGLASTVVAGAKPAERADRSAMAAAPKQTRTARVQRRQDAPSQPRVAQRENFMQSLFGRFGMF